MVSNILFPSDFTGDIVDCDSSAASSSFEEEDQQRPNTSSNVKASNYLRIAMDKLYHDKSSLSHCDIQANVEFFKNSSNKEQLFSFACFFNNVLAQALVGEYDLFTGENSLLDIAFPNLKNCSYDIRKEGLGWRRNQDLMAKSHIIVVTAEDIISNRVKGKDITNHLSLHTHSKNMEKVQSVIKKVDDQVKQLTNGMIGYTLEESDILEPDARIYLSILYFKGTWQHGLLAMKEKKKFTNIEGKEVSREYVYSPGIDIKVSRYMLDAQKLIDVFILPFNDDGNSNRFEAIYIAPRFLVSNAKEWKEVYTRFIKNYTFGEENNFTMKYDAFKDTERIVYFPKFDQVCEDINLDEILPETYQHGPNQDFVKFVMKVRVKIDEKGVEGAAAADALFAKGMPPKKIVVDKPYIALIYDRELRQTLFTVKDNGT